MKFSVIIPNFNSTIINQTLDSLEAQLYPKDQYEIIVVGLDEPGLVHSSDLVKFDRTERKYSPAEARNRGAHQSQGEILLFIDADCIASENLLSVYDLFFTNPAITGIGGGIRFPKDNYWMMADNIALFYEYLDTRPPRPVQQLPSLNLAVKRDAFNQVGGFDEKRYPKPAGEDFDFTYRLTLAGYHLVFEPTAWILHHPPRNSFKDLWRHGYVIGQYSTKVDQRYPDIAFPKWMNQKYVIIALAAFMAMYVSVRVYIKNPNLLRYIYLMPAIYLSKIAWCFGVVNSARFSEKL
jgi:glycosyltransferase involved in cell wall biosynthesis